MSLLILVFSFMVNIISLNSVLGLKANTPQSKVALQVVVLNCKVTKEQIPLTTKPGPPGHWRHMARPLWQLARPAYKGELLSRFSVLQYFPVEQASISGYPCCVLLFLSPHHLSRPPTRCPWAPTTTRRLPAPTLSGNRMTQSLIRVSSSRFFFCMDLGSHTS